MRMQLGLCLAVLIQGTGCDAKNAASQEPAPTSASAAPTAVKSAEAKTEAVPPKLGKLDEVDFEALKKAFKSAGWEVVGGNATKSAMHAITLHAKKDAVEITVHYYKNGGDFWEKRLKNDGAAMYKKDDVLVGVIVTKGDADPKKLLDAMVG